jgi:peroxiredoxin
MALTTGTPAPDFTLTTKSAEGPKLVRLSEHKNQQNVVLLFFPMAFTGVCTEELCSVTSDLKAYEQLNAAVYAISGDNPFAQEAWAQKEGISLTLLSDYEHHVARAYDVAYEAFLPELNLGMGGVAKRSAFVIDKEGIIRHAESSDDPKKLPDFAAIKSVLAGL